MKVKVLKYELSDVIVPQIFEMTKGSFKMYVRSRFLNFDAPTPPLFVLVCFQAYPPPPPQGTFVVARTHPLPHNFYMYEIYRQEINNEY